jgi:hypothetical protein
MQIRGDRQSQTRRSARRESGLVRRGRRGLVVTLVLALALALGLVAVLAPIGLARPSAASGQQAPNAESGRLLEREEHAAARQALKEEERIARARRQQERAGSRGKSFSTERDNGTVRFSCSQIAVTYRSFPDAARNTVNEWVKINKLRGGTSQFLFDGSTGSHTIPVTTPPGSYQIDLFAKWRTNGVKGSFDVHSKVSCSGVAFSIEKLQRIGASGGSYTAAPLTGYVGQSVEYEIVLNNTGYLPLSFSDFADAHCGTGTLTGGPGSEAVAHGGSTTYFCKHVLSPLDLAAGTYTNTATVRGSPPAGEGTPVTHTSNTVLVEMSAGTPPPPEEKTPEEKQTPKEEAKRSSGSSTNAASGALGANAASPLLSPLSMPHAGVLAFAATAVPALRGPGGCMRGRFAASLRSRGVSSVTFYLDGHKLRTMSARSARRGQLTITLDASKLRVGAHRLLAKITMIPAASVARVVHVSRALTFVRCRPATIDPKFTG